MPPHSTIQLNILSAEVRLEFLRFGRADLAFLLERLPVNCESLTIKQVVEKTGLSFKTVKKTLSQAGQIKKVVAHKQKHLQELWQSRIEQVFYADGKETTGKRPAITYHFPSADELNQVFGVEYPTQVVGVRTDSLKNYKADIAQFAIVKMPGKHTMQELVKDTGLHESSVRRFERTAGTTVVHHINRVSMAEWQHGLPQSYKVYKSDKASLRGIWLEWKGVKVAFSQSAYERLRHYHGALPKDIFVSWFNASDHFAREGPFIQREPAGKNYLHQINAAVELDRKGVIPFERFQEMYPGLFVKNEVADSSTWQDKDWTPTFD